MRCACRNTTLLTTHDTTLLDLKKINSKDIKGTFVLTDNSFLVLKIGKELVRGAMHTHWRGVFLFYYLVVNRSKNKLIN